MRLHASEWGDLAAPPVVCLHGVSAHGRRFRRLAEERLADRFHVTALDLRGHGRSASDPPWTIAAHVEDVLEAVSSPATWIGHSFGGRLVLEVAAREPGLVERAALLDPALWVPADIARMLADEALREVSYASVDEALEVRLARGDLAHTPRDVVEEEMREQLVRSPDGRYRYRYSREAVAAAYLELASEPPPFAAARVRTLLVVPSHGKIVSAGELERYRAALGGRLSVVVVPGGHMVLWDAYEETAAAVAEFLA